MCKSPGARVEDEVAAWKCVSKKEDLAADLFKAKKILQEINSMTEQPSWATGHDWESGYDKDARTRKINDMTTEYALEEEEEG